MKQSNLKKLCNFYIKKLNQAFLDVNSLSDNRKATKFIFKQSKKFFRNFYSYRATIGAARDLGSDADLKLYKDSAPAQFLIRHEIAFKVSEGLPVFTPWFFKGDFLVIHRCHLRRIVQTTFFLFDTFYRTSGLKHFIHPTKSINPAGTL